MTLDVNTAMDLPTQNATNAYRMQVTIMENVYVKDPGQETFVQNGKALAILFATEAAVGLDQSTVRNVQKALSIFMDAADVTLNGLVPAVLCLQELVIQNVPKTNVSLMVLLAVSHVSKDLTVIHTAHVFVSMPGAVGSRTAPYISENVGIRALDVQGQENMTVRLALETHDS